MGWSLRRSINLGPLRINLSRSGFGYSVGGRGFRVGQDARGRRYRSISIPKTGIYRRDYFAGSTTQTPTISPPPAPKPLIVSSGLRSQATGPRVVTFAQWVAYL